MGVVTQARIGALPVEFESDPLLELGETESTVLLLTEASSFDLWLDVPSTVIAGCTLRAYTVVGSVRALVATVRLSELSVDSTGERTSGVALTARGHAADAIEITAQLDEGDEDDARFFALAWSSNRTDATVGPGASVPVATHRYMAASPPVTTGTSGTTSIAYLSHRAGARVEIDRIVVSYFGADTGRVTLRGAMVTAHATPGGTLIPSIPPLNPPGPEAATEIVVGATSAPTRNRDRFSKSLRGAGAGTFEWSARTGGGPIVLPAESYAGFEIRAVVDETLSSGATFAVTFDWREVEEPDSGLAAYGFVHDWRSDKGIVLDGSLVASWKDQISGVVFTGRTTDGCSPPSLGTDGGAPMLQFTSAGKTGMDNFGAFFGATEDYTMFIVLRTDINPALDGFPLAFMDNDNHYRTLVRKAYASSWIHFHMENNNSSYHEAGVAVTGADWKIAILRRQSGGVKLRVDSTDNTASGTLGASQHSQVHFGYSGYHSAPYARFADMDVRQFALARRYLDDTECAAVSAILTATWPSLP